MVGDLLWLLGEEAITEIEGQFSKVDMKSYLSPVVTEIIDSRVCSSEIIKARVSEEVLEAAGLIKSAKSEKDKLQVLFQVASV